MKTFTICIPTYNRCEKLKRALNSLEHQTFTDFEVLIVDDGSTDGTQAFLDEYCRVSKKDVKYINKMNGGKHTAINLGIENAKGKFFLILDSDDYLDKNGLQILIDLWNEIPEIERKKFSGVMGRCVDESGKLIGKKFPKERFISSYVDFHFISGAKSGPYGDCCEFIKTDILKNYRYPEGNSYKFVPEAYIFDQVGIDYKLLCSNDVIKHVEYSSDGITRNLEEHLNKNIAGYLLYYICLLEKVFHETSEKIPLRTKIIIWWKYWNAVKLDRNRLGARIESLSGFGLLVYLLTPIINFIYSIYRNE
jgi:glycosyltransferase involved in cell wall biosynthesis